jgi:hypothetical protein
VDGLRITLNEKNEELIKEEDAMLVRIEGPHNIFMIKN